ncbi:MAG: tetraacyldisaccharide 4'-kinase [Candidatus Omnitrophota bacterium]
MKENIKKFLIKAAKEKRKVFFAVKSFLSVASFVYIAMIKTVLFLYRKNILKKYTAACPVISIGNISVGGTGKTPFVIYLGAKLAREGKEIAVVSRGYAADEIKEMEIALGKTSVFTGKNRVDGIKRVLAENKPDYIFLDDGFQHWKVKRDLDIVMIDASGFDEKEKVLPAGFSREPLSHIKRADVVLLSRVDLVSEKRAEEIKTFLKAVKQDLKIFEIVFEPEGFFDSRTGQAVSFDDVKNKMAGVFCGVGNNDAFVKTLEQMGIKAISKLFFLDHHSYSRNDLNLIQEEARNKNIDVYFTTFKDVLKIEPDNLKVKTYYLKIKTVFKNQMEENEFFKLLPQYSHS